MKTRKLLLSIINSALILAYSAYPALAIPSEYQLCKLNTTCRIGEFLYNDDYTPITDANCTLTTKDPSGNSYLSSVSMTPNSDGWYEYSFSTTGATQGIYPSQLCCTAGSDYLCMDKTFYIEESSSLTASEVENAILDADLSSHTTDGSLGDALNDVPTSEEIWNSPERTLTSFGSLAADVWNYSSRSLSSFGTLVSDIWKHDPTDASETENSAYNEILSQINENRTALEAIINEPIIKSFIEEGTPPDLQAKIDETRRLTNSLYSSTQNLKSRLTVLINTWDSIPKSDAQDELANLIDSLGRNSDNPKKDSILYSVSWLEDSWGNPVTTELANVSHSALSNLATTEENLDFYGNSSTTLLSESLSDIRAMEKSIGNVSNDSSDPTLFGLLKKVQTRAQSIQAEKDNLIKISDNLNTYSEIDLEYKLEKAQKDILAVNEFKGADSILKNATQEISNKLKNTLYSLQAILDVNYSMLAYSGDTPIENIWLEEGSIVFRSVITNPSRIATQTVPLKYLLPQEIKEENIISKSDSLTTKFDPTENSLYVEGTYELGPEESVVVYVETKDIWQFTEDELRAYHTQAEELLKSLEKSATYTQAANLESEINISIEKILSAQSQNISPSSRIRTFRENQLELLNVQENTAILTQLVATSEAAGSITGFIGGSQAIMAWGLIIAFIAGFAFLTLYMKKLNEEKMGITKNKKSDKPTREKHAIEIKNDNKPIIQTPATSLNKFVPLTILVILTSTISILILTSILSGNKPSPEPETGTMAPIEPAPTITTAPTPTPTAIPDTQASKTLGDKISEIELTIPSGSSLNLRKGPGTEFPIVISLKENTTLYLFNTQENNNNEKWAHVGLTENDSDREWWILYSLLENNSNISSL